MYVQYPARNRIQLEKQIFSSMKKPPVVLSQWDTREYFRSVTTLLVVLKPVEKITNT